MIRVVLDTNIVISALLSPQGPPAQVLLMTIIDPDTQLCVSGEIFCRV
jgi:putative PIN family toxin of toxin-antitoxin system